MSSSSIAPASQTQMRRYSREELEIMNETKNPSRYVLKIAAQNALYGVLFLTVGVILGLGSSTVGGRSAVPEAAVAMGSHLLVALGSGFLFFACYTASVARLLGEELGLLSGAAGAMAWAAFIFWSLSQ